MNLFTIHKHTQRFKLRIEDNNAFLAISIKITNFAA